MVGSNRRLGPLYSDYWRGFPFGSNSIPVIGVDLFIRDDQAHMLLTW